MKEKSTYIALELEDGRIAEYQGIINYYIDNTESGTSLLIIKINKEHTAFYNMNRIIGFSVIES